MKIRNMTEKKNIYMYIITKQENIHVYKTFTLKTTTKKTKQNKTKTTTKTTTTTKNQTNKNKQQQTKNKTKQKQNNNNKIVKAILNRNVRKRTLGRMYPAKIQIRIHFHAV